MLLRTLVRRVCALRHQSTDVNYAFRKDIIAKNPSAFYPTIRDARDSTPTLRIPQFVDRYRSVDLAQYEARAHPDLVQLEGRVKSIRRAGRGLFFIDVVQDETKVQIYASNKLLGMSKEDFSETHSFVRKGDHIVCVGNAYKTNVGELTLRATTPIKVASPCLNSVTLPEKLATRKTINSNRVVNYLIDAESRQRIVIKSLVVQAIRSFLLQDNYTEVQTPILAGAGTGANAEPFETTSKAVGEKLSLRVAPELWLKKLVIGGFDKVFEIGMNFRNEGVDATHNPEFMTCEFYRSHTSLPELMGITEELFAHVHGELSKMTEKVPLLQETLPKLGALSGQNFQKYEFIPTIEQKTGVPFPATLDSPSLLQYYEKIGLEPPAQKQPASLLDNLSGIYLESISNEHPNSPVFIYNQPAEMSPLAKSQTISYGDRKYDISLRFELFINGKEYVNSYEEENSPFAQKDKFVAQQQTKADFADPESLIPDWNYVQQMEYGLPPTGGWGCGIDRLSMLFSGAGRIEDVLTFGTVRDVIRQ